jgi:hypothetical protein
MRAQDESVDVDVVLSPGSLFVGMRSATWSMMALMGSVGMNGKDIILAISSLSCRR